MVEVLGTSLTSVDIHPRCLQKLLHYHFGYDKITLRHNLIFGQTIGEVFFTSVKKHSLFWLSLVVCQKLCRSNRSYVFFGA